MKILVTGGAGYIGSVISEKLFDLGNDIVVLDSLERGHRDSVHQHAEFFQADVADKEALFKIFSEHNFDAVMHLAGYIQVSESVQQPERYFENNYKKTLVLLDVMNQAGIKKIVLSSTAAVYGTPEQAIIPEDHPTVPINPYGETKLLVEKTLLKYKREHGFEYAALRFFNASGATKSHGERHYPETHLIPLVLEAIEENKIFQISGGDYDTNDGTCIRDFIHVSDIADAHIAILGQMLKHKSLQDLNVSEADQLAHHAYNIGTGHGYSVKDVIKAAESVTGSKVMTEIVARRPGDPPRLVASAQKLLSIGWQPKHSSLKAIIESAWEFRKNQKTKTA